MDTTPFRLQDSPVAFGADRIATPLRKALHELGPDDALGVEALLGLVPFTDDASVHADHWERHPAGDEILHVLDGRLRVVLEDEAGGEHEAEIGPGQTLITPRGLWHRLCVLEPGRLMFLTPTSGVELRPHAP